MDCASEDSSDNSQRPDSHKDQRVYFVPHRWWKDAQDSMPADSDKKKGIAYASIPGSSYAGPMKIINTIFSSDLAFSLRREEDLQHIRENGEVGVSGRDFALVSGDMWLQALKWHSDSKNVVKDDKGFSATDSDMSDVYPLQLRLSVQRETNSFGVRISKKDNAVELFKRACKMFSVDSEMLCIWDYSGQITFLMNDKNQTPVDCQRQSDQEILLELQVYGLTDSIRCKDGKKDEMANFSGSTSLKMNGSIDSANSDCTHANSLTFSLGPGEAGSLGLTGLQNLGNTCFMNSSLQCLAHTPKLVDYFLEDYVKEINHENPLGMNGEIALAFGDLLRKLWAPGASPVAPRVFKSKLARFAPQFSGFNQHDSQELLAFLLDGLHEDLNRVKCKPYVEVKDGDGRPDEEVADEYWHNHLARNDSVIVDVCQGQYKSTLVCPICRKVSVTFDPFMYLSLPLPSTTMRTMTITVVSGSGDKMSPLSSYTISVPKNGRFEDLTRALSIACSLGTDETLLVAEVYNNCIIRFLEDPTDSLSLIRDADKLVAYRFYKNNADAPLVVFINQQMEEQFVYGKRTLNWKAFGIPVVARLCNVTNGSDLRNLYLKWFHPFQNPIEEALENCAMSKETEVAEMEVTTPSVGSNLNELDTSSDGGMEFYHTDEKGTIKNSEILMNEPLAISGELRLLHVLVCWSEEQIKKYDTQLCSSLPEVFKSGFLAKRSQESVSLYKCLEAFLQEEPLGPEDMWYCPGCKKHRQASKKLDLWRLPKILVIHLKRFQYSRYLKNKLETCVDFPVDNLDLTAYISHGNGESYHYTLYAVSNHYGSMGGGHYTAFVHRGGDQWYDFDDSHVNPISKEKIKSSAAYVLFYRRSFEVST
ncbi:ubiquitin carboxyl-terminal hydrolase 8 [Vigna unguiculata]|uniref:Ubiquitin carboxyl-terminal hydrolase n=1 Tax=Vigna unguiculata TaxID=3917 RepID=A0A4D6N6S9_VIGUN|nr:ubiquitin carboxyl-terminal hydrolase 8 [Vigna unguiculata]QCE09523.1 ubiquitin carboxyl-terminal hydrolase 4/11/15 [Vigna unguiculata]